MPSERTRRANMVPYASILVATFLNAYSAAESDLL
jgi:hypothetical protein